MSTTPTFTPTPQLEQQQLPALFVPPWIATTPWADLITEMERRNLQFRQAQQAMTDIPNRLGHPQNLDADAYARRSRRTSRPRPSPTSRRSWRSSTPLTAAP